MTLRQQQNWPQDISTVEVMAKINSRKGCYVYLLPRSSYRHGDKIPHMINRALRPRGPDENKTKKTGQKKGSAYRNRGRASPA
jgi:hypothetical protein